MPIMRGATPAVAEATKRARGFKPYSRTAASDASSSAAAPSFTPDALPAVTVPSGFTIGFKPANPVSVVSGRECSSAATSSAGPFFCPTGTGVISSAIRPSAIARAAFSWLRNANRS